MHHYTGTVRTTTGTTTRVPVVAPDIMRARLAVYSRMPTGCTFIKVRLTSTLR
jgi:hypothetical protein